MVGQCLLPNRNWTEAHATSRKSDFLTALGPTRASANLRCPRKECAKPVHLISSLLFNAAVCAAHTGNALTIILAALWKTISTDDQVSAKRDDSALAAHSQLTGDVGEVMSLAILCHRQIW